MVAKEQMKNLIVAVGIGVVLFIAGGGWQFFSAESMQGLWHAVHSDFEYASTYWTIFFTFGIAQSLCGFFWALIIMKVWPARQEFLWLWAFLAISLALGGYKFYLSPAEYFFAAQAGNEATRLPLPFCWALPFLVNGGGLGLTAAGVAGLVQKLSKKK
jgi:hypothetical protein